MAKKEKTEAEKKAWGEKMRLAREAKKNENTTTTTETTRPEESTQSQATTPQEDTTDHIAEEQGTNEILKQLKELQESNALLKAAFLGQQSSGGVNVGQRGNLVGEVEKYLTDPANYPDPTIRLRKEPRLQPLAFDYNYELDYEVGTSSYENIQGVRMREPKFHITLNRIVLDDQGQQTQKRYIARKLIFHEDPQAAIVIARDNGLEVDKSDEKKFLDEMRYLRVRDWLFDIFWQKPATPQDQIREEVIGGTMVQVFTKSSVEASNIDFDKIKAKVV